MAGSPSTQQGIHRPLSGKLSTSVFQGELLHCTCGFVINSRFELEFPILQLGAKLCLQNSIYTWLILQIKLIKSIKLVINQMKADCKN